MNNRFRYIKSFRETNMTDKGISDLLSSYKYYEFTVGLASNINEKVCNNLATRVFENYPYCEKHYPLVAAK